MNELGFFVPALRAARRAAPDPGFLTMAKFMVFLLTAHDSAGRPSDNTKNPPIATERSDQGQGQRKGGDRSDQQQTQDRVSKGFGRWMIDQQLEQVVGGMANLVEQGLRQTEDVVLQRKSTPAFRRETRLIE